MNNILKHTLNILLNSSTLSLSTCDLMGKAEESKAK